MDNSTGRIRRQITMKFETPIISISKFETEDVVTTSGLTEEQKISALETYIKSSSSVLQDVSDSNILTFTY